MTLAKDLALFYFLRKSVKSSEIELKSLRSLNKALMIF